MTIDRKVIVSQLRDLFLFLMASILQAYLTCSRCSSVERYVQVVGFTFAIWVLLWKGNSIVANVITKRISWIEYPGRRFIIGIVSTIGYSILAIISLMTFFESVLGYNFGKGYVYTVYGSLITTILISLFLHSRSFLMHWRQATIQSEKYEKESIAAKYESLKNQVNPHFLFNSLNALTNLVYEDQDKAVKFIKQLSEVYRYVLDTRDKEVVVIEEELKFLQSYLYLQQIRFGNKLKIEISLSNHKSYVTPLALQMLIENAIKHNVVSEDSPLNIKLFNRDGFIIVENNLYKKTALGEPSAGVGLENICKRYELLSNTKVQVIKNTDTFTVKLPELISIRKL